MMESKPVAFQFAKSVKKPAVVQTSLNSSDKAEDVDFVKSVADSVIESTKKRKEYVPLVIPLKKPRLKTAKNTENKQASVDSRTDETKAEERSLDSAAAEEILQETSEAADALTSGNRVTQIETSSSTIVQGATIGEVPTLEDYADVPVEEFGKALLRGMGWKDGDGTGRKGEVVGQFEAVVRPKGLGLGATASAAQNDKPPADGAEQLQMAPGAYVVVTIGKEKGGYGQVSSLDGDGRALVKMAMSGDTVSLPEGTLQLVTKKDYKRNSRVINQDKYNEYKERQEKEHGSERERAEERRSGASRHRDRTEESDSRPSKHRDRADERHSRSAKHSSRTGSDRASEKSSVSMDRSEAASRIPWVRPHLRVRCIDQKYKKGRYYKEKLTVVDVITAELCVCEDPSGRLLEDVSTSQLETVVPRHQGAVVMVINGSQRGQVGEVVERDQKRCRATVQLLSDRQLATLDYDDICHYVGSVEAYS